MKGGKAWGTIARFAWVAIGIFGIARTWIEMLFPAGCGAPVTVGLALFVLLVLFETTLDSVLVDGEIWDSLRRVSWSVLPFLLLGIGWTWIPLGDYPTQDLPIRKAEIAWGILWIAHLACFIFSMVGAAIQANRRKVWEVFAVAGTVFFLGTALQTQRCDLTGDEPHYLLMAHSLWVDRDLEISNNYGQNDARHFYQRGPLAPQGNEHVLSDGSRYSHHPLGPVLVFLPGYLLAGRSGASLTVVIVTAGVLAGVLAWLTVLGFKPKIVEQVGWVGLFASPLLLYEGLLFPEMLTAGVMVYLGRSFMRGKWFLVGLAFGALLWMHNRNVLLVIPFFLVVGAAWQHGKFTKEAFYRLTLGFLWLVIPLAVYFYRVYGVWTPLGAHHEGMDSLFPLGRFAINFPGLLLDQEAGLWFYFPILALVPAGLVLGWKRGPDSIRAVAIVMVAYYGAMSFYQNLGLQPAARFLAPITPILLILLAPVFEALEKFGKPWRVLAVGLFGVTAILNLVLAAIPWMRYNRLEGASWTLRLVDRFTGLSLTRWEPSFHAQPIEARSYLLGWGWLGVVGLLTILFLRANSSGRARR